MNTELLGAPGSSPLLCHKHLEQLSKVPALWSWCWSWCPLMVSDSSLPTPLETDAALLMPAALFTLLREYTELHLVFSISVFSCRDAHKSIYPYCYCFTFSTYWWYSFSHSFPRSSRYNFCVIYHLLVPLYFHVPDLNSPASPYVIENKVVKLKYLFLCKL